MKNLTLSERAPILLEVLGFVVFALASKALFSLVVWRYAGPISLILTLVVLTLYLRRVGVTWDMLGLRRLPGMRSKLLVLPQALLTFGAFALTVWSVLTVGDLLNPELMLEVPDGVEDRWGAVEGNLPLFLLWLAIIWTSAAFGEEMFFRGYLITRLEQAFSGSFIASVLAVLLAAALFGYGHMYYQGLRGFFTTGAIAIAFGIMFLLFKKNLWPIILVHGLVDTLAFTALFLGIE